MIEMIGVAITGFGLFGLIGAFHDEKPDNTMIGICISTLCLGLFITSLAF
tara:strand:- start:947 stop:1096 length:150 start_codon:yes stop_codon:yes gene_type:complete